MTQKQLDSIRYEFDKTINIYDSCIDRLERINSFYVSLQTALIGFSTFLLNQSDKKMGFNPIWILGVIAIILTISWILAIHKQLQDKERVQEKLFRLEKNLELNLFRLASKTGQQNKYLSVSRYESAVPYLFLILYFALVFAMIA